MSTNPPYPPQGPGNPPPGGYQPQGGYQPPGGFQPPPGGYQPQGGYPPPGYPPPGFQPPQKKKTSPVVWVVVGLGVFFLLIGMVVLGAALFFVHKAKQAGLDPDLMQRNPAIATVKMMAALNPDIDLIKVDEGRGLVVVRDKKSGKTFEVNMADAKNGKFSMREQGKAPVTISATGNGPDGSVNIQSAEGTATFGGSNVRLPGWLPAYSGSKPAATFSSSGADGDKGAYSFTTPDPAARVADFYESGLRSAGLKMSKTTNETDGKQSVIITGQSEMRTSMVIIGTDEKGQTTVGVTYESKK